MTRFRPKTCWLAAALTVSQFQAIPLRAQVATNPPPPILTNSPSAPPRVPRPLLKSPVALFRELLTMNFIERTRYLTNRSPEDRKLINAKLREYQSLRPDARELRLRVTELRWYMLMLMRLPPSARAGRLNMIPPEHRELVEARLQEWDKLPPNLRKELLDNEAAITYFTELEANGGRRPPTLSPALKEKLEAGIQQWQDLSEDQRQKIMERFNRFFTLDQQEKEKALSTLSDPERRQIEKTLRKFDELSPAQRAVCIRSFEKFTTRSLHEKHQLLKNADRWKLMSPDEPQAWRELVSKVPVTPPALLSLPRPPRPPGSVTSRPALAATNGN